MASAGPAGPAAAPIAPGGTNSAASVAAANQGSIDAANKANAAAGKIASTPAAGAAFVDPNASQAVIATSTGSRATTAANVTSLNNANAKALASTTANTGNGAQSVDNSAFGGPNATQAANANTAMATPSSTTTAPSGGTTNTFTPPQGANTVTLPSGAQAYYTAANGTTQESMTDANGNALTYSAAAQTWIDPKTGQAPVSGGTAGSSTTTQSGATGTSSTTDPFAGIPGTMSSADIESAVTNIDPSLQGAYRDSLNNQNQSIADAYNALQAASTMYTNSMNGTDATMVAAANAIAQKYGVLIQQMQAQNKQVLGRSQSAVGAFGGLGVMGESFMNDETSAATSRIGTLTNEMQSLILQSNAAYQSGDLKAFNAAQTAYDKANTDMASAMKDVLSAADANIKNNQAQAKATAKAYQDQVANDHTISLGLASTIAGIIGTGDPSTFDYAGAAKAHGISDPAILAGAVSDKLQANAKDAATAATAAATQARDDATAKREDATLSVAQQRLALDEYNATNPKPTAAETDTTNTMNNLLDGASALTDLVSSTGTLDANYENVKAQLVQKGFYNATPPAWFNTAISSGSMQIGSNGVPVQNQNGAPGDMLPTAIQSQWTAYKNKVLGISN